MFLKMKDETSIAFRIAITSLVTASMITTVLFFTVIAIQNESIKRTVEQGVVIQFDTIKAAIDVDRSGNLIIVSDREILLNRLHYFWQITSGGRKIAKSSRLDTWLDLTGKTTNELSYYEVSDNNSILSVALKIDFVKGKKVEIIVGDLKSEIDILKDDIKWNNIYMLAVPVIIYIILLWMMICTQVQISIAPLKQLKDALKEVCIGNKTELEGNFPKEVKLLVDEMNILLTYTSGMLVKYKNFASNLAHSLRPPIFVLSTHAKKGKSVKSKIVEEKSNILLSIVDSNLARFRVSGTSSVIGAKTECLPVINSACNAFGKTSDTEISIECQSDLYFHGDEGDFIELLGNLIRNATQHASSKAVVKAFKELERLIICIEDDGPGIPGEDLDKIMESGTRLDESMPGHGIGLSICKEIVELYSGSIDLGESDLGGLKVTLELPIAKF